MSPEVGDPQADESGESVRLTRSPHEGEAAGKSTLVFSPAFPFGPPHFDVPRRINQLKEMMNPNSPTYMLENQHPNLRAVIHAYETGAMHGKEIWLKNGKIVPRAEAMEGGGFIGHEVIDLDLDRLRHIVTL